MDSSELPSRKPSQRRELQGPRPTPLGVPKDSHRIRKAPVPQQHRTPVIIYHRSPRVIHAEPSEFMSLVQRLTGAPSSSSSSADAPSVAARPSSSSNVEDTRRAILSPAARFATIEKGARPSTQGERRRERDEVVLDRLGIHHGGTMLDGPSLLPSILSPVPSSLPSISPNFFSPSTGPDSMNFLHRTSSPAAFDGSRSATVANTFPAGLGSFLSSPMAPSPGAYSWDLFGQFQDF